MDEIDQRAALAALITRDGTRLATLSRVLGRNAAWMQQYLRRGTPRMLTPGDRATLAGFFGVEEAVLGGGSGGIVRVPRLDIAASAGPGRQVDGERAVTVGYAREDLASLGVRAGDVSEIRVEGDSMEPVLRHGDRILVDRAQRRPGGSSAIWVVRTGDELRVKRLRSEGAKMILVSDNAPEERHDAADVVVVGRVVRLMRTL